MDLLARGSERRRKGFVVSCAVLSFIILSCVEVPRARGQEAVSAAAKSTLIQAADAQQRIVDELASILRQEQVVLSDAAIQDALRTLLADERKLADGIRELGKRTLGRGASELTEQDRVDRDRLAGLQADYAGRYQRVETALTAKLQEEPDSMFVAPLQLAMEAQLSDLMTEAGGLIGQNQLGKGLRVVNRIVATLEQMVDAVGEESSGGSGDGGEGGFAVPGLWLKGMDQQLAEFGWPGDAGPDALGKILRHLRRLDELAQRQRELAVKVKAHSNGKHKDDDLAKQEWEIRYLALEVATELVLLDPQVDQLIRQAVGTIEKAIVPMENGPVSEAAEPAARAADELQAAADRLRVLWQAIIARIKQYTQQTAPKLGGGLGIPHGMSKEMKALLEKLIFLMIRATGAMTEAMDRQTNLIETTRLAEELTPLKAQQEAIGRFVTEEVLPHNIGRDDLPAAVAKKLADRAVDSSDFIQDAFDRMERATAAIGDGDKTEALKREQEALELLTDAHAEMVLILQHLLGQFSPPGMSSANAASGGMALDPSGKVVRSKGWLFGLPSEERQKVLQAFQDSFPLRYDDAIKRYYQIIAKDENKP